MSATVEGSATQRKGASEKKKPMADVMNSMKRNEKMIRAMADNTPEWLKGAKPYLQKAAPILAFLAMLIDTAAPYVIHGSIWAYKKFKELPDELEWAVFGVWLCFFGGVYPVLVLTVETFLMTGWDQTSAAILELYNQFLIVQEASKKDDERDDDGDGIRDVDQRSGKENFTHKMDLFLKTADPKKIQSAAGVVFNAWFAVVAVLRVEFAKTTALGVAIGDATFKTIGRVIVPICDVCMPEKYAKWVPMVAKYMARAFGMYLAWTLQAVISAFHSGIRGGFMAARMGLAYKARLDGKKFNDEDTYLDEALGGVLALIGFWCQITMGFQVPFPLNIFLLPFDIIEWGIRFWLADSAMF